MTSPTRTAGAQAPPKNACCVPATGGVVVLVVDVAHVTALTLNPSKANALPVVPAMAPLDTETDQP